MNKKLLIGVAALLVVGAGVFLLMKNGDDKKDSGKNSTQQTTTQPEQKTTSEETTQQGSLSTIRSAGAAKECTMSYSDDSGTGNGKMYTDGKGRGRMTLDISTARGNQGQSNTLMADDKVYSWTKTDSGAIGFVFDASTVQPNSSSSPSTSSSQTAGKNFDLKCKNWTVDESLLAVPTDVKFTAMPSGQ